MLTALPCCMAAQSSNWARMKNSLRRNGYYTDLYNKQLLEEELAEV